ncbi:MAG: YitT family protein [Firmicutes bacterium]|nr:YitT family protein [Bacillota bacterium]
MKETWLLRKAGISMKQIGYLLAANVGYALALNLFYVNNNIAAGGLAGIGTVLNYFLSVPVGLTVFILNIPIVLWGVTIKGKRYVIISVITVGVYSLIVDILSFLPCLTDDKVVAVVCGGILYGAAASLSVRARISTGGTDLLAKLLITKFKSISIGQMLMTIDGSIVVMAMIVYKNIEAGIYAILAIAVAAIVTDKLNSGFNKASVFYIFANKNLDKIASAVLEDMGRGATLLPGKGLYSHAEKEILFVVVKPSEVPRLKDIVHRYDKSAFIILSSASEIIGSGFETLDLTSSIHDDDDIEEAEA